MNDSKATGQRGGHRHRSSRRSRSHDAAQAEAALTPLPDVPDHPLIASGDPEMIQTPDALDQCVAALRQAGQFAYDTEFIGELSYHPQLCLVQVATCDRVALIDPMAGLDLTPLWELIADPAVETIVHAGQQDLEPVARYLNRAPARIFDIQIAAGFAGHPYPVALSHLVKHYAGVSLGKGLTFTNWGHRPLSAVHLRYAADDVRYLPALRQRLGDDLRQLHHEAWAAEELAGLQDVAAYRPNPEAAFLRFRGAKALRKRDRAFLRELIVWRDATAKQMDMPPRSLMKDEALLGMARQSFKSIEDLHRVRFLPRPVIEAAGQAILDAFTRACNVQTHELPPSDGGEESPDERIRVDSLWAFVSACCHAQRIDPALVASRQEVARFFRALRRRQSLEGCRLMTGWRRMVLGEPLTQFVYGQSQVTFAWRDEGLTHPPEVPV
ncbi:MAG: ribonuclease D [Phycisphaeraceae bacterium]|nr:ribonuclease D [Phycisphaeraceae bacterium]